jgi:hypothetical protein
MEHIEGPWYTVAVECSQCGADTLEVRSHVRLVTPEPDDEDDAPEPILMADPHEFRCGACDVSGAWSVMARATIRQRFAGRRR